MDNQAKLRKTFLLAQELLRREAQTSLIQFCQLVNPKYKPYPVHYIIADYLERLCKGEFIRLMIFVPPRIGKSELGSRNLPAWYMGKNAGSNVIMASYASPLSEALSRAARRTAESDMFEETFDARLAEAGNTLTNWSLKHPDGSMSTLLATSVLGSVTGHGCDLGIIDDPVKSRKEAESETIRQQVKDWYSDDFYSRADNPDSRILIIQTRWHEQDLSGWLLSIDKTQENPELRENWTVLLLPAICEEPECYPIHNPLYREALQDTHFRRNPGESIHPDKYPLHRLRKIQILSPRAFRSLYQQKPSADDGDIFKNTWWRFYNPATAHQDPILHIHSWDTGQTVSESADYSVGLDMVFDGLETRIRHRWKHRLNYPELKALITESYKAHRPDYVLVEYKSSGISIVQDIQDSYPDMPIIGIPVNTESKKARAISVSDFVQSGRVYLPQPPNSTQSQDFWTYDFINQLAKFPNAAHDDDVDAFSQGMRFISNRVSESYFLPYLTPERSTTPIQPHPSYPIFRSLYIPQSNPNRMFYLLWFALINRGAPPTPQTEYLNYITNPNQPSLYVFAELASQLTEPNMPLPSISALTEEAKQLELSWRISPETGFCNKDMFNSQYNSGSSTALPLLYLFADKEYPLIPTSLDVPSALAHTREMFIGDGSLPALVISNQCKTLWQSLKSVSTDPNKFFMNPYCAPTAALIQATASFAKQTIPQAVTELPEDHSDKEDLLHLFRSIFEH